MTTEQATIIAAVAAATNTTEAELLTDCRTPRVSIARFLAMLIYSEEHPWSSNLDAARAVGKKDPSTGRHGLMRAAHLLHNDEQFKAAYANAKRILANAQGMAAAACAPKNDQTACSPSPWPPCYASSVKI